MLLRRHQDDEGEMEQQDRTRDDNIPPEYASRLGKHVGKEHTDQPEKEESGVDRDNHGVDLTAAATQRQAPDDEEEVLPLPPPLNLSAVLPRQ